MPSERATRTSPFAAMDVLERANAMDDVVHMEVGEPDFEPPAAVTEAAVDSLRAANTDYTSTKGKPALREAIAAYYDRQYGVTVDPERIVVTPGSSPALLIALTSIVDPDDEVVLTDPHYACYPNFVYQAGGRVRTVPLEPEQGFEPDPGRFAAAVDDDTAAMMLNSPANPTGAVMSGDTIAELVDHAERTDTRVVADEVYHGLSYGVEEHSVLEYTDEAFVLDGVSKRYGMTGWRLGWMVAPPDMARTVNRVAQNVLICAPNFVQDAAIEALRTPERWLEQNRETYRERRDQLLSIVDDWGLGLGYEPGGAYYLLVDVSDLPGDAFDVADLFLEEAGVAVTPGPDFGDEAADYLRLSYATGTEEIDEAGRRVRALLDETALDEVPL
ncbi:MAG: pyridoxal phosphate-dependent aminotransferase [Halobacteriaceae archaeon]